MKKIITSLIIILLILLFPFHSYGIKKLGQTGFKFLDVGVGSRPAGMGEAFTMIGDDANALFYNPAGIARMEKNFDILASRTDWFAGIAYNAAGLVINGGIWGNIGISAIVSDYGTIYGTRYSEEADEGYIDTGELISNSYAIGFTYARSLTDRFTVGGTAKFASQRLGSNLLPDGSIHVNEAYTVLFDIGTIFYPGIKSFRLGMTMSNLSTELTYEEESFELPLKFRVGVAMDILDFMGEHPNQSFVLDIEAIHPRDYTQRLHIGGEYWYRDMFALRGGYKINYDEESFTAGLGFKVRGIKIDYSYGDFGFFDSVNRFSIGLSF